MKKGSFWREKKVQRRKKVELGRGRGLLVGAAENRRHNDSGESRGGGRDQVLELVRGGLTD